MKLENELWGGAVITQHILFDKHYYSISTLNSDKGGFFFRQTIKCFLTNANIFRTAVKRYSDKCKNIFRKA